MDPRYHDEVRFSVRLHEDQVEFRYTCNVHRDDLDQNLGTPYGDQYFKIRVSYINMRLDRLTPNNPVLRSSISVNLNFLGYVPQNLIEQNVRPILLRLNIPQEFCNPMTAKILNFAQGMVNTTCRSMVVDIMVETFDYRQLRQVVEQSMEDQHQALVPASKASIEELERVKIGGEEGKEGPSGCSICWEDFKADDEAICMPCEHLFHSSCILHWLQRRNSCPLCRFELPPAVDGD